MFIRQTDRLLIILCTLAASYGFLLVYSATTSAGGGFSDCLMQLVCIALGIVAALVISRLDYEFIASLWPFLAGVSVLLVLLTFTSPGVQCAPVLTNQNWLGKSLWGQRPFSSSRPSFSKSRLSSPFPSTSPGSANISTGR